MARKVLPKYAETEARRALSLNRNSRNGLIVLASALASRDRFDEALENVDHLLRLEPGDASALALRKNILANRGAR